LLSGQYKSSCQVSGHEIVYHQAGCGEPIILVHGITTYSFIWRKMFSDLAKNFQVIALDLLGCGESAMPLDTSYAVKDHAKHLYEFVKTLGIKQFHLVGHDLGGGISQIFATQHPEMLYDLCLLNTVAYDFWPVQPINALRTPIVRQLLMASVDLGSFHHIVKKGMFHQEKVTVDLMELFLKPLRSKAGRKAFLHFAKCLDNHNLMEISRELRQLRIPVLIIRGTADPYLSAAISQKLHSEIPASELLEIATASHYIQEDEPEILTSAITKFMTRREQLAV